MNIIEEAIRFSEETLLLTNQRIIFWPRQETLILADLHLGKPAHFRKNGIALPSLLTTKDLARLEALLLYYNPKKVIIAGDFIHAGTNKETTLFVQLTQKFPFIRFQLVTGNHDRLTADSFIEAGMHCVQEKLYTEKILFLHQPPSYADTPVISGHIHPGIQLLLPARKKISLPCYLISEHQLILPAFSLFTGLDTSFQLKDAVCYAFHEEGIFKIV